MSIKNKCFFFILGLLALSIPLTSLDFSPSEYLKKCEQLVLSENSPLFGEIYDTAYINLEDSVEMRKSDLPLNLQIQKFLKESLNFEASLGQIQSMNTNAGSGLSGNPLYRIVDEKNCPVFVIKVFIEGQGSFSKEFLALKSFETLSLEHLQFPRVRGIDALELQGKKTFFLAMTHLPGNSLHEMFAKLAAQDPTSPEREREFQKLLRAYKKLAKGLAHFHNAAKTEPLPLHPVYVDIVQFLSQKAFETIELEEEMKQSFAQKMTNELNKVFVRGYMHGDANAGNYLYDEKTGSLSMIDLTDAASSIGPNKTPTGIPFFHLAQVRNRILKADFTNEEKTQLESLFFSEYALAGGELPSSESLEFFCLVDHLQFFFWYHLSKDRIDPNFQADLNSSYQRRLEHFKNGLQAKEILN